ncbi:LIC_11883 family protein [Leptospira sp. 'Mane']|uniref:LIC_11883 family protein n=1 Tax=Leptospira sp. 'Mane' TaxID=3387407 RepID=UPI00398A631E
MFLKKKSLCLLILGLIVSPDFATPNEISKFYPIPKKQFVSKLKGIAFATIRSTITREYSFTESKEVKYVPCTDEFPKLPGDFPCSLLSWDEDLIVIDDKKKVTDAESIEVEPVEDHELGGSVLVLLSRTKSPNQNGKVVLFGEGEETLKLFYLPSGFVSHYHFKNEVIVFKWANDSGKLSLTGIVILKLDSETFPVSGKELNFLQK